MNLKLVKKAKEQEIRYIVIGASAGGVEAIGTLVKAFQNPSQLSVSMVLHLPPMGPNLLPDLFQDRTQFHIKEAESGESLRPETIYIAAPNYHLNLESNGTLSLSNEEAVQFSRPSIDLLFESAAFAFGQKVLGILLTGANSDGARGLATIQKAGGLTIIQTPSDAEYPVMPQSGLDEITPDAVMPLSEISIFLKQLSEN